MCSLFHALILRVFLVAPEQGAARMLSTRVITSPAAALELVAGALEQLPSEPVAAQQVGGGGLIYVVPALGEGEGGGLPIIQPHRHTRICSSSSLSFCFLPFLLLSSCTWPLRWPGALRDRRLSPCLCLDRQPRAGVPSCLPPGHCPCLSTTW